MPIGKTPTRTPPKDAADKGAAAAHARGKDAAGASRRRVGARAMGVVDRTLGRIYGVFAKANHWMFMGGMFAGLLGKMKGVKGVGGIFGLAEKVSEAPGQTTMGQVGAMLSPSRILQRVLGDKGAKTQEGVSAVEGGVTGAVGWAAKGVSGLLGKGVESGRGVLIDPLAERMDAGALRHASKAQNILADAVSGSKGHAALGGVRRSLEKASAALKGGDDKAYVAAMEQAQEHLKGAEGVDKKVLKAVSSGLKKAGSAAEKGGQRGHVATKLRDLPGSIRNAPDAFKNASVQGVVMKGALITGTALQVTGTARGLSENIGTLKDLYSDMTGEKKISTRKLLFSKDVPDIIKESRSQLMKQFGPRVLLDAANIGVTAAFSVMRHNGLSLQNKNMKLGIGSVGLQLAGQWHQAKSQESFLPIYDAVSQMPKLEDAQYAVLISSASKQAAKIGGVESELIQSVSVQYAREGLPPVEVLKEIENGRFDERCLRIMQESRKAMGVQESAAKDAEAVVTEAGRIAASAADPAGASKPLSSGEQAKLQDMEAQFTGNHREDKGIHTRRLLNETRDSVRTLH